ncbi:hypothetical protein SCHPADRAFT_944559 [Schizopora paradoxa]|uniref:F-box domain-containing protein n=1 Tax=Schizopora paradoxa TaxID=27342 RepID=A0A0H2R8W5_9AGAM|nr:hypothetical protein SCHPADRAFT_944559 [Schizopora paradoxa]
MPSSNGHGASLSPTTSRDNCSEISHIDTPESPIRIMEATPTKSNERLEISKVLLALENAAKLPNFHEVDLSDAFRKENWNIFQNVYGGDKGFANDEDDRILLADATWPNRLKESTYETCNIYMMLKALRSAADELLLEFETSQERVAAVKRSKGMKSLPDEILSKTFLMAFWGQHSHRASARQAMWLSGVSRRFRNVALGTRGLWTILSSSFSRLQLETIIARAGSNEGFHIFLNLDSSSVRLKFFDICRSIIPRWKTLTLEHDKEYGNDYHGALENLLRSFVEHGLCFPILEELNVHGPYYGTLISPEVRGWAPNLRTLRCSFILLSLSSPIPSISTLVISTLVISSDVLHYLYASESPVQMLLGLLLKLPNLSSFELEAEGAHGEADIGAALPVTECPLVTSFHLRIQRIPKLDLPTVGHRERGETNLRSF